MALASQASRIKLGQAFGLKKGVNFVFWSLPLPSSQAAASTRHPTLGSRRAWLQELINFPARREDSFTPEHRRWKERLTTREEKTADPTCPVKTSLLLDDQQLRHSRPDPSRRKVTWHSTMRISPTASPERYSTLYRRTGLGLNFQLWGSRKARVGGS